MAEGFEVITSKCNKDTKKSFMRFIWWQGATKRIKERKWQFLGNEKGLTKNDRISAVLARKHRKCVVNGKQNVIQRWSYGSWFKEKFDIGKWALIFNINSPDIF